MKKLTALALAAVSAPLAIGLTAAPAQASVCDDFVYPPTTAGWGLRISPGYALVRQGTSIQLFTRLVRTSGTSTRECPGERVGWYARPRGGLVYKLSRATTTGGRGLVGQTYLVRDDFRWYTDHLENNTRVAESRKGLIQIRRPVS